ncbi:MAG TPA: citrate/2-methylcitrate synthase [Thermomicrobiales bacterium]|nr:citrate/2-methylcitrate synthase [Thermomicrobiales bacterium]HQZ89090.1 citrate/2-methylcitrate synthase [Thermomicrobiales bacterium]HRA30594.1 citrate/2-methylcitrate synthase [Thermomicrobiales bacterium]
MTAAAAGLEGLVVAQTQLSSVNGTEGILTYRGYNINDLAGNVRFEEVMYLLWYGALPTRVQLDELSNSIHHHRQLSSDVLNTIRALPRTGAPIDSLKVGVTALGMEDANQDDLSHEGLREKATRLAAAMPTVLAAYQRLRNGQEPIAPDTELGTAANFLYMVRGEKPTQTQADAFNLYLCLLAEHSMNASTFTARSTISSTSDLYSAVTAALGSLKGVAHGGANMMAMNMLLEIHDPAKIEDYVDESLRIKRRLMGLGHRIYKTRDPRVNHLMKWSEKVANEVGDTQWYQLAHNMEQLTNHHPYFTERKLYPNVEFYSAPLLYNLGFPPDLMPAVFALSRIAGWSANIMEQMQDNRLMRPQAEYVGPAHQDFVPIDQRG